MSDERVVPGHTHISNVQKHIARYNIALQYCVGVDVLDIACGTGYGTQMISRVANKVDGVDRDKKAIEHAVLNYSNKNIDYWERDFFDAQGKYDTIICFETLEHIKDFEKSQEKLLSLLNPGGIIVFSLPLNEEKGVNEYHYHTFTPQEAAATFADLKDMGNLLQVGINFFAVDPSWDKNFSYFIGVRKLA